MNNSSTAKVNLTGPSIPSGEKNIKEVLYTVYRSSLSNHGIIMKSGKVLHVINHELITCDQEEIDFIEREIASGFPYLSKSGVINSQVRDPLMEFKAKIIQDYEAKKLAEAGLPVPVIGNSNTGNQVAKSLSPASTAILAKLSAGSDSPSN